MTTQAPTPVMSMSFKPLRERCFGCGYKLQGISAPVRKCPECGRANPADNPPPPRLWLMIAAGAWLPLLFGWQFGCWRLVRYFQANPSPTGQPNDPAFIYRWLAIGLALVAWPAAIITVYVLLRVFGRRVPVYKRGWIYHTAAVLLAVMIGSAAFVICFFIGSATGYGPVVGQPRIF